MTTSDPTADALAAWRGAAPAADLADFLRGHPELSPAAVAEACAIDLRRRRGRGERPAAEDYLALRPDLAADPEGVVELAYAEFVAREAAGERPDPDALAARFPAHADRIRWQLRLDEVLGVEAAEETTSLGEAAATAEYPSDPARVGRYAVLGRLDVGGQAVVYRAAHPTLQTEVVVKLGRAGGAGGAESLRAEGRVLATLDHPNLARVFDLDEDAGRPFLVMEYVRGRNLRQSYADARPAPAVAARLVAAAARAADHAHRLGVIHLDIKPANVVVDPAGRPRLIDFGLARLTPGVADGGGGDSGDVSGTAAYMAPEQARGEAAGPPADVFGLGGVLYFLLTGTPPFLGTGVVECLGRSARNGWDRAKLAAPGVPRALAAICAKALASAPAERYASAAALAEALDRFAAPRRRPWAAVAAGVAVACAAAACVVALWPAWVAKVEPAAPPPPSAGLEVRAWVGDRFVALPEPAPLRTGQRVQVAAELPAGHGATLFLIGSAGRLVPLAEFPSAESLAAVRYPAAPKTSAPLTGPPGTEVVLLVARPGAAPSLAEVADAFGEPGPWPTLPTFSVLYLNRGRIETLQRSRDLGTAGSHADPEGDVRDRLAAAGGRLRGRFVVVEAVAFRHAE